jgi:hypothetical protein
MLAPHVRARGIMLKCHHFSALFFFASLGKTNANSRPPNSSKHCQKQKKRGDVPERQWFGEYRE